MIVSVFAEVFESVPPTIGFGNVHEYVVPLGTMVEGGKFIAPKETVVALQVEVV